MDDTTATTLKSIVDLGGTAILTAMLYLVWQRLNTVTDRLIEIAALLARPDAQDKDAD